ncbi:MAG: ATP-binding cassette domain-containing protein [Nocardioides sp.]|nr:ATP-binding cassette domain-containing protein [Nocardioides sp.]
MIELRSCTFDYDDDQGEPVRVLDAVDLVVEEGELLLVAGRTGVGKSTLLGLFTGLVPRFTGGSLRGDVLVDGSSILHLPPRERAHMIGSVGQDPAAGFVTDTVEEELAYGMEQLGYDPATMRRRVEETLDLLGIPELRGRDLRTLSGGQQQRVAIGAVLTTHPRVLVLDEPTSALDPTAAEDVLATLTRLVHDVGVSVVVAEHRLERVVPFADRMAVLDGDGRLTAGEPQRMLESSPVAPPIVELGRLAGWQPLPLSVRDARRRSHDLRERLGDGDAVTEPPDGAADDVLLQARGVTVVHDSTVAVRGVDLDLRAGEVTGLMGRNGSGKSSLLWALQGSGRRTAGSVRVATGDPRDLGPEERRRSVGLVPQTAADLLYLETVAEECAAADRAADAEAGTCTALLERLVPAVDPYQHPRDLSEGQRLALVLAIVLTTSPRVLVLDEPTRGLDYPGKAALAAVLRELAAEGHAVLVASHDVEFVAAVSDDALVLADGEVVSRGPAAKVVTESPGFAPQTAKILGPRWLTVAQVRDALARVG